MEIKKKCTYIFGHSAFSEIMASYLKSDSSVEFGGFIVDDDLFDSSDNDSSIIGWNDFVSSVDPEFADIIVTIGYSNMNRSRQIIFERLRKNNYHIAHFYHPSSIISKEADLGEGCIVLEHAVIQPFVKCGEGNIFWSNVNICHHTDIGNFNFFAASCCVLGKITIGDYCFVGSNATIRNKIHISNETLVGAGAFVTNDTLPKEVVVPSKSTSLSKKSNEIKI